MSEHDAQRARRVAEAIGQARAALAGGDAPGAIDRLRTAIAADSFEPALYLALAEALAGAGRQEEALGCAGRACALAPAAFDPALLLGELLVDADRADAALGPLGNAARIDGARPRLWRAYGRAMRGLGDWQQSALAYARCMQLARAATPAGEELAIATLECGEVELTRGQNAPGLALLREAAALGEPRAGALLDADALAGAPLCVTAPPNAADTLALLRFLPHLPQAGPVTLIAGPGLAPALNGVPGVLRAVAASPQDESLRRATLYAAAQCAQLAMPNPGGGPPYLALDKAADERWRARLSVRPAIRIGVCDLAAAGDGWSVPLLDRLLAGVSADRLALHALDAASAAAAPALTDLTPHLASSADLVAAVEHLDLVIGADGLALHLAAALGRPAWVFWRAGAHWSWGAEGEFTPWHPSALVFRRGRDRRWDRALERAAGMLVATASGRPKPIDSAAMQPVLARVTAGDHAGALRLLAPYVERCPDIADAQSNLGFVLDQCARPDEALPAYLRAVALHPVGPTVLNNLGAALQNRGQPRAALARYRRAAALAPGYADAHRNMGSLLADSGEGREAAAVLEALVAREPQVATLWLSLAKAWYECGDSAKAQEAFQRAIRLAPDNPVGYNNYANMLQRDGRFLEAIAAYRRALARAPGLVEAEANLSAAMLATGDWARGWDLYEKRWVGWRGFRGGKPETGVPEWDGGPLTGKTLFVHAEQGLGDEIMFSSVLPELLGEARQIVVECTVKLEKLFRRSFPGTVVLGIDRTTQGWQTRLARALAIAPRFDLQTPIGSLARWRRRSREAFPRREAYLRADPGRVAHYRERLAALGPGLKIGVSWRGGTPGTGLARRSVAIERWLPILRAREAQFVSLQYTDCHEELAALRAANGVTVHHWEDAIAEYDDTAALVCALDAVVTVCTAVVHLAGALGQRAIVLAPSIPEWRYGTRGDRMPWYAHVRLLRQAAPGDWDSVVSAAAQAVKEL